MYFANRFNVNQSSITFADIERLANDSDKEIEPLKEFYNYFDRTNFAEKTERNMNKTMSKKAIRNSIKKVHKSVKVTFMLFVLCYFSVLSAAEIDKELLVKTDSVFNKAHKVIDLDLTEGELLYKNAAMKYELLAKDEDSAIVKSALLYNAGNAYYFANDYGMSIYNYLNAKLYTPNDDNLNQSLAFLRTQCIDQFEKSDVDIFIENAFFWHYHLSSKARLNIFYTFYFILCSIVIYSYLKQRKLRIVIISMSVLCFLLATSIITHRFVFHGKKGVITADTVVARKGDNYAYDVAFNTPLHSGTEFRCIEQRGEWTLISLVNGDQCWVLTESIKLVNR